MRKRAGVDTISPGTVKNPRAAIYAHISQVLLMCLGG